MLYYYIMLPKHIGIIGACAHDIKLINFLQKEHSHISIFSDNTELNAYISEHNLSKLHEHTKLDMLIVSAEINPDYPDTEYNDFIHIAKKNNADIINNIELYYKFHDVKTIAVAGSYSKTTIVHMLSHVLAKSNTDHYASNPSNPFQWPASDQEYILLTLSIHLIKYAPSLKPYITLITNLHDYKQSTYHTKDQLKITKQLLDRSQIQIIQNNSLSAQLASLFPQSIKVDISSAQSLHDQLTLLTHKVLQKMNLDHDQLLVKQFTPHNNMQIIFQNDELTIIDNNKAKTIHNIIHSLQLLKGRILLILPEPTNIEDFMILKEKKYLSKLKGIITFNTMQSQLQAELIHLTQVVNAITFEQACVELVNKFNKIRARPLTILFVGGQQQLSKPFHKAMMKYTQEPRYYDSYRYDRYDRY